MNKQHSFPRYSFRKALSLDLMKKYFKSINNFLEIGPGRGDFTKALNKNISTGTIIDFSDEAIQVLNKKFINKNIEILKGDFLDFNFSKKYDLIVMFEVLEHIKNDNAALKKINSLLSNDSLFLFSVPSRMDQWGYIDILAGHVRRYEKKELIEKLELNNFKIIEFHSYGWPLINIIAKIRNWHLSRTAKIKQKDNVELTKKSGLGYIKKDLLSKIFIFINNIFFSDIMIKIYLLFSKPFDKYDLGDGYLVLVKKNK